MKVISKINIEHSITKDKIYEIQGKLNTLVEENPEYYIINDKGRKILINSMFFEKLEISRSNKIENILY